MYKFLVSFLIFSLSSFILSRNTSFAQNTNDDQLQRQIDEVMKAREEMLKSLMDDSFSGEFEKRMEDIMKRFGGPGFSQGFGNSFLNSDSLSLGSYNWDETETHKILKIKVTQSKDQPLDIKIENGMVNIKGIAESMNGVGANKMKSRVSFQKSFSLPNDIDQNNPEFKNNEKLGELSITFKKILAKNFKKTNPNTPNLKPNLQEDKENKRQPLTPSNQDISI